MYECLRRSCAGARVQNVAVYRNAFNTAEREYLRRGESRNRTDVLDLMLRYGREVLVREPHNWGTAGRLAGFLLDTCRWSDADPLLRMLDARARAVHADVRRFSEANTCACCCALRGVALSHVHRCLPRVGNWRSHQRPCR